MTACNSYREALWQIIGSTNDEDEFTLHDDLNDELMKLQESKDYYKDRELIANSFEISQMEEKIIIDKVEGTEVAT